ncbi:MAG: sigma-70 family RNA polymerase sigma factor [Oscillospiraceae bacterium]|jgi:RNA polymerase sigma-70 factor (ECF subfamily)|nr:sigma-70 family RNA polymerase sigma factor [Oscillospiraceae bacterium]
MNKDAFVQQIGACSDKMYRVAYTLLRSDADCKDALQEAALRAWEKRGSLRDESRFAPWVMRILLHECYALLRKRRRSMPLELAPELAAPPPDGTLAQALQALPEKLRLPLVLCYANGMTYAEIAEVLHLPQSTIRGRIHRAKQQLRKELEA